MREVPGLRHLLETDGGLFLVDCGLYMGDDKDGNLKAKNLAFPHFNPKKIKAVRPLPGKAPASWPDALGPSLRP